MKIKTNNQGVALRDWWTMSRCDVVCPRSGHFVAGAGRQALPSPDAPLGDEFFAARKTPPSYAAFTLIEMILAIGIAAIVLLTISTVLFTALHLRNATTDLVDAATPVDQTVTYLRRDLQCLMTPTNGTSKFLSGSFKAGNVSSPGSSEPVAVEMFTATGALSSSSPWADVQRVTYELKNSPSGGSSRDLYRSVSRNLLTTSLPEVSDQLMLSGVENIKFFCYDGARWNETWDTSDTTSLYTNLPLAVRVEIHMAGNNATAEPIKLVVPVDAQSRTNMVLTATSGS